MTIEQADALYLDQMDPEWFHYRLAKNRARLFKDEDFKGLYCSGNGRPSVPPSLLAVALLLQVHDDVSDEEAVHRASWDVRWCVALGVPVGSKPFAKSTLQLFRSQLVLHPENGEAVFLASIEEAKRLGLLKDKPLTVAVDTTPVFGRGAVEDTYNLLATGIVKLVRAMAAADECDPQDWAAAHDLKRFFAGSIKGEAAINWDEQAERDALLASIVGDARRLLVLAGKRRAELNAGMPEYLLIGEASELLCQLLAQDVDTDENGKPFIKEETAKDRIPSAHDPDMRHGRKSASSRFDGHKAGIAVDTETGLAVGLDVLPGNAPDNHGVMDLVKDAEANTGCPVDTTIGDCAYGDGNTRREFADAKRKLVAKVPSRPQGQLSKDQFIIDLDNGCVTCPAGHTTRTCANVKNNKHVAKRFYFPADLCAACPRRSECVKSKTGGRTISIHPDEALLQAARAYQRTEQGKQDTRTRQVVEHYIARLIQLGMRQSRYVGRKKARLQLLLTATVANLTRTWNHCESTQETDNKKTQKKAS
ncbi:MAG: IS1182 family transposase [Myxococcales bacterium]|nr:IS1182 family transposase [Myxococcales bacterium]